MVLMIFWKEYAMEKNLIKKIAEIAIGGLYKNIVRNLDEKVSLR